MKSVMPLRCHAQGIRPVFFVETADTSPRWLPGSPWLIFHSSAAALPGHNTGGREVGQSLTAGSIEMSVHVRSSRSHPPAVSVPRVIGRLF